MELYRPSEKVTARGICLSVALTGAMAALLGFCYASVVGYFPPTNFLVGGGAMILFGGLLGKGLEKVLHATGVRSPFVARVLAGFGIVVGIWSTWAAWLLWDLGQLIWRPDQIWRAVHEVALRVPNHAGLYLYQAFTTAVIAVMCFHNLRWEKYGHCDGCNRWLEPTKRFGRYQYRKDILLQLEAMKQFREDALDQARPDSREWYCLNLATCPKCGQFSTMQVVKWKRHPFGLASKVLGLLRVAEVLETDEGLA